MRSGGLTTLRQVCDAPARWHALSYRLPIEGTNLGVIEAASIEECRSVCEQTPSCNSFAHVPSDAGYYRKKGGSSTLCHLKGQCVTPGSKEATLDATPGGLQQLSRVRTKFVSQYQHPCSNEETVFPIPGIRRSLPLNRPTGLATIDCQGPHPLAYSEASGWVPTGINSAKERALLCRGVPSKPVAVHKLRWPRHYSSGRLSHISSPSVTEAASQAVWQGKDIEGEAQNERGQMEARWLRVARDVAARSFNGKEIILISANSGGLPLAINLVANLAQLGQRHVMLFADDPKTCTKLRSPKAPPCVWSSQMRQYHEGLATYHVDKVAQLWISRYYMWLRLTGAGYNVLLLDADVVLFHDPYKYLKGLFGNYSLISLGDSSAGYAKANGGIWYGQNVVIGGPTHHIFSEFHRRTSTLIAPGTKTITRHDKTLPQKRGAAANILLYDQSVINNCLLSAELGYEAAMDTHTAQDLPDHKRPRGFWRVYGNVRTPSELGTYDHRYPAASMLRQRVLTREGITETVMQAPPWLFAAESDADTPPSILSDPSFASRRRGGLNARGPSPGRTSAAYWGTDPVPVVLLHFVCSAWPGSGGRISAMELWGKWFSADISEQLGDAVARAPLSPGLEVDLWIKGCGLACGAANCNHRTENGRRPLEPCASWLEGDKENIKKGYLQERLSSARNSSGASSSASRRKSFELQLERFRQHVAAKADIPPAWGLAFAAAASSVPGALIAFRFPILAADRREYQLLVRVLHSAAMLTARRPVAPLAYCSQIGQWSTHSRCVWVQWAAGGEEPRGSGPRGPRGSPLCLQRLPSACHGKVALPGEIAGIPEEEVGVVTLPRLQLRAGRVDAEALGAALGGAAARGKRLLLLDASELRSADEFANLILTPKGWLCTLDHKSCQHAC